MRPRTGRDYLILGLAGALLSGYLLLTSFRRGWTHVETDFPNYYTAAVLTLRHQPLRQFYDWTWFQRQMNYTGTERQLGGYTPHTPITMLPLLPFATLPPQQAKQFWLALGLLWLAGSIALLARLTGFHPTEVLLLALLSYSALSTNFLLGQYYLLVLALLTSAAWCLLRGKPVAGGALIGLIFAVKLYTAPFFLYFAVRRQWKALAGMVSSVVISAGVATALFGFDAVRFFVATVMARGLDGSVNDPYHPGWGSMTAFLRHTLLAERELNPHPLLETPALYFFLRTFYTLAVLAFSLLVVRKQKWDEGRTFGWFVIVLFALSPNTASYHFVLLLVPVVFFLRGAPMAWSCGLLALYGMVEYPLRPWDAWLFPRAWLLLALLIYTGWYAFRRLSLPAVAITLSVVTAVSAGEAWRRTQSYRQESPRTATLAVVDPVGVFSWAPASAGGELIWQAIDQGRYLLRATGTTGIRTFAFEGQAFHPAIAHWPGPIYFELAAQGHSRIVVFDPTTGRRDTVIGPEGDPRDPAISIDDSLAFVSAGSLYVRQGTNQRRLVASRDISGPAFFPDGRQIVFAEGVPGERRTRSVSLAGGNPQDLETDGDSYSPAVSPDGRALAFTLDRGTRQVWVRDLLSGHRRPVSSGACNNDVPAWRDSHTLVFASDCSRGLGLPALYQVDLSAGQ